MARLTHNHGACYRLALLLLILLLSDTRAFIQAGSPSSTGSVGSSSSSGASARDNDHPDPVLLLDALDLNAGQWQDLPAMPSAENLAFAPKHIDFVQTTLANHASHAVTIYNNHRNQTVYLSSVFAVPAENQQQSSENGGEADDQHNDFHVPYIRDLELKPGCNATINVVFLPTRIGAVSAQVLLRTSFGQLKLQVQGVGVASPFKVVPMTHLVSYAGGPFHTNAALIPDIHLYNPYEVPIQITEVFSSGGKFYLELPTKVQGTGTGDTGTGTDKDTGTVSEMNHSKSEETVQLWTIAAYERRPVIRVRFVGSLEAGHYSAYIRMRIRIGLTASERVEEDETATEETVLIIPVRMEVRPRQVISLYAEKSLIDLGSVLQQEKSLLHINLRTSETTDIGVASLTWSPALAIGEATTRLSHQQLSSCSNIVVGGDDMDVRLKIECDIEWAELIRNASRKWDAFKPGKIVHVSGDVTVNSMVGPQKSPQVHRIPLVAEIVPGAGLELPPNVTVLFPNYDEISVGMFYLRNSFETTPIVIREIKVVEAEGEERSISGQNPVLRLVREYFKRAVVENNFPKILRPGESWTMPPVTLSLDEEERTLSSFPSVHLEIATNVTRVIKVPLYGYSSRLSKLILSPSVRSVLSRATKQGVAAGGSVGAGVSALKESEIIDKTDADKIDFGSVRLDVEGQQFVALLNENPVPVELLKWSLDAMDLQMTIVQVGCMNKYDFVQNEEAILQPDDWCVFTFTASTATAGEFNGVFRYETTHEKGVFPIRLLGNGGELLLSPNSLIMRNCFPKTICFADIIVESTYKDVVTLQNIITHKDASVNIFTREILPETVTKVGLMHFNPRMNRNPQEPPGYTNAYSNQIFENTNDEGLLVLQRTALSMFRVLRERQFQLPFQMNTDRQIVNSVVAVNFIWPRLIAASDAVTEHVVHWGQSMSYNVTLTNPSDESISYWYYLADDRVFIHSLPETTLPTHNDAMEYHWGFQVLKVHGNKGKEKIILGPGEKHNLTVHVSGDVRLNFASVLVIKNNFTFYEAAWQILRVVTPQFRFGNRKPFSTTPLLFELQDQPQACVKGTSSVQQEESQVHTSAINTRRVFTAKNTGELPLTVRSININSEPCIGFGFVVLNCAPFVLAPNETHRIEISFVPDFSISRVERKLEFILDVPFPMQFTLVGAVPQSMLDRCRRTVSRPWWEASLKKWAISALATMAVIVATVAYFESVKILKDHLETTYRQRGPFQAPLDFRKLTAMKSSSSISGGGGGGQVSQSTKESAKGPKKRTQPQPPPPPSLFNSKRFTWFINRSQKQNNSPVPSNPPNQGTQETVAVVSASASASSNSSSDPSVGTPANDKAKQTAKRSSNNKGENKSPNATVASVVGPAKSTVQVQESAKKTQEKAPSQPQPQTAVGKKESGNKKSKSKAKTVAMATGTKLGPEMEEKLNTAEKDLKAGLGRMKGTQLSEPVTTTKETTHPAVVPVPHPTIVPHRVDLPEEVSFAERTEQSHNHLNSINSPKMNSYGKTPGRERKEKQQSKPKMMAQHSIRANKGFTFQEPTTTTNANEHHQVDMVAQNGVRDPWTNVCRDIFQGNVSSGFTNGNSSSSSAAALRNQFDVFDPSLNFSHPPLDVSGLNDDTQSVMSEDLNAFPENPLGAIGPPMPAISKSYSLFDGDSQNPIGQQTMFRNPTPNDQSSSLYNGALFPDDPMAAAFNENGFGYGHNNNNSHPMVFPGNYPLSSDVSSSNGSSEYGFNHHPMMDAFAVEQNRTSRDLYTEFQYQRQELQRLALLLALNQQQQQQQTANTSRNTHNDYMGGTWSQPLDQQQQLQQIPQQRQQMGLSGRGPPPGLLPRHSHGGGGGGGNGAQDENANHQPSFDFKWNQWNNNPNQ